MARNLPALATKIVTQRAPPIPSGYSQAAKELLELMLKKDPAERPSVGQVCDMCSAVYTSQ